MTSTILILRNTFRLHDNPALQCALQDEHFKTILIPIDKNRVLAPTKCIPTIKENTITQPRFYTHTTNHLHAWGYHQYYLLLHIIHTFVSDIHTHYPDITVVVAKETLPQLFKKYIHRHSKCVYDRVDDPAWASFNKMLYHHFKSAQQLMCVSTHTLLDWNQTDHKTFFDSWVPKRHNQSFKDYVFSQSFDFAKELAHTDCRVHHRDSRKDNNNSKTCGGRKPKNKNKKRTKTHSVKSKSSTRRTTRPTSPSLFRVLSEIQKWRKAMVKNNIVPFEPPPNTTCEQWALDQLTKYAQALSSNTWEKPKSQSILAIREYGTQPQHTTSKLSPFFALGALSVKYAYVQWQGKTTQQHKQNASRPSSAIAQLLWREEFHACSMADGFWHTRDDDPTTRFWKRDKEWSIWKSDDERLQPFLHARATKTMTNRKQRQNNKNKNTSTYASTDAEVVPMQDTNSSLLMLAKDGWIHHLRRHVIADYLTRGYLDADWMLGESWFRQTLLDHDASVNRGNWLWLSACDFSTAQLCRHYNHDNYVRRQSDT